MTESIRQRAHSQGIVQRSTDTPSLSMPNDSLDELHNKLACLRTYLEDAGSVAVTFSGGIDSTFLLQVAHDVLGDSAVAITAHMVTFPEDEYEYARAFCREHGIEHVMFEVDIMSDPAFIANPPDHCYICKRTFMASAIDAAREHNLNVVVDGSNVDDQSDYRPGRRALDELGIISPLAQCGFTKDDIRALSLEMGISIWNKPSKTCYASRFAYGDTLSVERFNMVEAAERLIEAEGFESVRVRVISVNGPSPSAVAFTARIEVEPTSLARFSDQELRERISSGLKRLGFTYVTLDLDGFRTGSMNETLK